MNWKFNPLLADDLIQAEEWYSQHNLPLADRFRTEYSAILNSISVLPEQFPPGDHFGLRLPWRYAKLKHFPYAVVYRWDEAKNQTTVVGILQLQQAPQIIADILTLRNHENE